MASDPVNDELQPSSCTFAEGGIVAVGNADGDALLLGNACVVKRESLKQIQVDDMVAALTQQFLEQGEITEAALLSR